MSGLHYSRVRQRWYSQVWAGGTTGLWGRKGLQHVGLSFQAELLEHVLVIASHLTGVALNPAHKGHRRRWRRSEPKEKDLDLIRSLMSFVVNGQMASGKTFS